MSNRLPEEYQEIEYLESTYNNNNGFRIGTGIYPTNNTSIEFKIMCPEYRECDCISIGSSDLFNFHINYRW